MAHEVVLPQWSMGMQDGELLRWLKRPGDAVTQGEVLAEVESSKTVGEVVADRDGVFLAALVAEGQVVAVRAPLCLIGAPSETVADRVPAQSPPPASVPGAPAKLAPPRVEATPVARKLARDHGVDLAGIAGSGPGGRIVEQDVRAAIERSRPQRSR